MLAVVCVECFDVAQEVAKKTIQHNNIKRESFNCIKMFVLQSWERMHTISGLRENFLIL